MTKRSCATCMRIIPATQTRCDLHEAHYNEERRVQRLQHQAPRWLKLRRRKVVQAGGGCASQTASGESVVTSNPRCQGCFTRHSVARTHSKATTGRVWRDTQVWSVAWCTKLERVCTKRERGGGSRFWKWRNTVRCVRLAARKTKCRQMISHEPIARRNN